MDMYMSRETKDIMTIISIPPKVSSPPRSYTVHTTKRKNVRDTAAAITEEGSLSCSGRFMCFPLLQDSPAGTVRRSGLPHNFQAIIS